MVSAPPAATQEAANFASHRRRDVAAAPRRPPSLPFLPLPPPLQNIISGSHLELSISNPRAAAAAAAGELFAVYRAERSLLPPPLPPTLLEIWWRGRTKGGNGERRKSCPFPLDAMNFQLLHAQIHARTYPGAGPGRTRTTIQTQDLRGMTGTSLAAHSIPRGAPRPPPPQNWE